MEFGAVETPSASGVGFGATFAPAEASAFDAGFEASTSPAEASAFDAGFGASFSPAEASEVGVGFGAAFMPAAFPDAPTSSVFAAAPGNGTAGVSCTPAEELSSGSGGASDLFATSAFDASFAAPSPEAASGGRDLPQTSGTSDPFAFAGYAAPAT